MFNSTRTDDLLNTALIVAALALPLGHAAKQSLATAVTSMASIVQPETVTAADPEGALNVAARRSRSQSA